MNEPQVSVVIVSYNVKELLRDCLHSVFREGEEIPLEVIVVDNASHDGSAEMVAQDFPQVKLIINDQNLGFAKATNQGMRESRGEYLLLLNPDTVVHAGALREMLSALETHPAAAIVAPRLVKEDGAPQGSLATEKHLSLQAEFLREFGLASFWAPARRYLERALFAGGNEPTQQVEVASGACMLVRREAVNEVGLLDERFFFGAEDHDWCLRMHNAAWKILYWPRAVVTHLKAQSRPHLRPLVREVNARQVIYHYFCKHRGRAAGFAFKGIVFWAHVLRGLRKILLGRLGTHDLEVDAALIRWALLPRADVKQ